MRQLIRLPGFLRLGVAYTLNELTDLVGTVALAVLVYRRTGSVLGSSGFFLCAQAAPAVLSPVLVAPLERFSPRVVLPSLYALEALLFGLLAYMTARFSLAPVLVIVFVVGAIAITARSLASAARTAILKPTGLLREGNALVNGAFSVCFMAGPLLGGVLVAVGGTVTALLVNCGLFAAMALTLISTTLPSATEHEDSARVRLRAALSRVRRDRPIFTLISLGAVGTVFFTISVPIEVVYASHTLHAGASGYGELMAAWGAGAIVGSLGYARWRRSSVRVLATVTGFLLAAGFAILTAAPDLVVALIGGAVAGVGNAALSAALATELQERTPQGWMALVSSLSNASLFIAPGLGIVLGGAIASLASTRVAFGVAACASLCFGLVAIRVLAPSRMTSTLDEELAADTELDPKPHPETIV